jgi:hypothetical protein
MFKTIKKLCAEIITIACALIYIVAVIASNEQPTQAQAIIWASCAIAWVGIAIMRNNP